MLSQSNNKCPFEVSDKCQEVSSKVIAKLNGAKFPLIFQTCKINQPNKKKRNAHFCLSSVIQVMINATKRLPVSPHSFSLPCTLTCVVKILAIWKTSASRKLKHKILSHIGFEPYSFSKRLTLLLLSSETKWIFPVWSCGHEGEYKFKFFVSLIQILLTPNFNHVIKMSHLPNSK